MPSCEGLSDAYPESVFENEKEMVEIVNAWNHLGFKVTLIQSLTSFYHTLGLTSADYDVKCITYITVKPSSAE